MALRISDRRVALKFRVLLSHRFKFCTLKKGSAARLYPGAHKYLIGLVFARAIAALDR